MCTWEDPRFHWTKDFFEARGARNGVRACHPLLDRPLAEYVLAIPFRQRIPSEGKTKHLLRMSLGARIPDLLLRRSRKVSYDSYIAFQTEQRRVLLESELIQSEDWRSRQFIDPKGAARLWNSLMKQDRGSESGFRDLQAVVNVECWLRRLQHYRLSKIR